MEKVNNLISAGSTISGAIKEALGKTVVQFADDHQLPRPAVSNAINGNVRASDAVVAALAKELGGTEDEWRELLWLAGKPGSASGRPTGATVTAVA
jgi:plasmid maintenance system antidote protein VapI